MKVSPKIPQKEIQRILSDIYDDNWQDDYYDGRDLGGMGYSIEYSSYSRTYDSKISERERIKYVEEFCDDLYDEQVAFENRRKNRVRTFTEKIPMSEIEALSAEELIAYHKFLQDLAEDE